jgi:hypothetical protein
VRTGAAERLSKVSTLLASALALAIGAIALFPLSVPALRHTPQLNACLSSPCPPTILLPPPLELEFSAAFAPKVLPRKELAPVALGIRSEFRYSDGSPPPPLKTVTVNLDRNWALETTGLPACGRATLAGHGTAGARRICRNAIVGSGITQVVVPSSQRPVSLPLTLFNGGDEEGTTTLLVHSRIPASPPVVVPVKLSKHPNGIYELEATAAIPQIAGGKGSVLSFSLSIRRFVGPEGVRQPYVVARCRDERIQIRMTSIFVDGTTLSGTVLRACSARKSPPGRNAD